MADDESCRLLLKECNISDKNSLSLWTANKNNQANKDRAAKVAKCAERLKIATTATSKAISNKPAADESDKKSAPNKTDSKPKASTEKTPKPADKSTQVPPRGSPAATPSPSSSTSKPPPPSQPPHHHRHVERKKGALTVSFLPLGKVLRAVQSGMQMYGVALDALWPLVPSLREGEGFHWRSCQLAVRLRHQRLLLPFKPWTESELVVRLPTGEGPAPSLRNAYGFGLQSAGVTWKFGSTSMLALSKVLGPDGDGGPVGGSLSPGSWLDNQRFKVEYRASLGPLRLDLGWKASHDHNGLKSGGPTLGFALEALDFSSEGLCIFPTEVVSEPVPVPAPVPCIPS